MCGIFSYIGRRSDAHEITLEGLKRLEYRGYDSWGIAYKNGETEIATYKKVGKISDARKDLLKNEKSSAAIGHSRWATHGGVNKKNAHPHLSEDGRLAIVHNGIFENYEEIKKELKKKGHKFKSATDTEVAIHLIEDYYKKNKDIFKSVKKTLKRLEGRYAILVLNADNNTIVAARRGSPLIIGKAKDEFFVASDVPAFLPHTNKVMYLDDDQMAVIDGGIKFFDLKSGKEVAKRVIEVDIDETEAEKGEFEHFMIKEIMDQKDTLARAINQKEKEIKKIAGLIEKAFGTYFVGCGTAGKVCLAGTYVFSQVAKKHVNFEFASEFEGHKHFIKKGSLVVAISQSGETADTLEALKIAKEHNALTVSIVNVESSTMARTTDYTLPIKAGPEKAVASTKATTSQLAIIILLAYAYAGELDKGKKQLIKTAANINDMLNPRYEKHILKLAQKIKDVESMYIIGKGVNYPMALESAIKLQEVSYIHAEGFAGGELKHGPLALISKGTPVIVLAAQDEHYKHIISNAKEIQARGGFIIGVSPESNSVFDYWIKVPNAAIDSSIINIIPVQILAYHLAVLRNNDPDKPRNLAKSVTVK